MAASRPPSPSTYTDDLLALLFALGGETLAFYELKAIAAVLEKTAGTPQPEIDECALRDALLRHPRITTSHGNYFSFKAPDMFLRAIRFLEDPAHAAVPEAISKKLPRTSTEEKVFPARLARDLRNSLFIRDFATHQVLVSILRKEFPADFTVGKPYRFLAEAEYNDWLATLPHDLLSICLRMLIPPMIRELTPVRNLLETALAKFNGLYPFAQFHVVDAAIVTGDLDTAEKCLGEAEQHDPLTAKTRFAWLHFIRNRTEDAARLYTDALEEFRRSNVGYTYFFPTVTGVFFILTLLREHTPAALSTAKEHARCGFNNVLYGNTYRLLSDYIRRLQGEPVQPAAPQTPLDHWIAAFVCFWRANGQLSTENRRQLTEIEAHADRAGYRWFADEIREMNRRLQPEWLPDSDNTPPDDCAHVVDCVRLLPDWIQRLNGIHDLLTRYNGQKEARTLWALSFSPEDPTQVTFELFIQHKTKTDRWSKGQFLNTDKIRKEIEQNEHWPDGCTTQDIHIATELLRIEDRLQETPAELRDTILSDSRNTLLFGLIHSKRLFWSDDPAHNPVTIELEDPYIQILRDTDRRQLILKLVPEEHSEAGLVAVRTEDNRLRLFSFTSIHYKLLNELRNGFRIPEQAVARLCTVCCEFAKCMKIKSDLTLDALQIPHTEIVEPQPVIRIEQINDRLSVELLVRPFPDDNELAPPGLGTHTVLLLRNGQLTKIQRDADAENQRIQRILDACPALTRFAMDRDGHWTLENNENAYAFILQVGKLANECTILWKHDRKLRVSPKISFANVKLRAGLGTRWLDIDGDITVDDSLTLSFQQLLQLAHDQKGTFIRLDNGQIITLADEFRASIDRFNAIGRSSRSPKLQLSLLTLPVLRVMLGDFHQLELSDDWTEQIRRIDEAKQLNVPPPDGLSKGTVLRDYQLEGYRWLTKLDHWGAGACLADDMGLGKTIQAIAFIAAKAHEGPALVVAPTSVCQNWIAEFERFAPALRVVPYGQGNRAETLQNMKPGMVMISSYGLLQSQINAFEGVQWRVVVLDEAQAIKNYQAKRSQAALQLQAKFRIATTGTPIENNLGELWTLFQFITPGLLGTRQAFQERFSSKLDDPAEKSPQTRDDEDFCLRQLNALIKPFLLRRKKDDVLRELPPKTETAIHVYLSAEERAFYEALRRNLLEELDVNIPENPAQRRIQILTAITRLRQAACNPLLIEPGTKIPSAKLEQFRELVTELKLCGHKTLIFSQFVRHLEIIRPTLRELGITYEYLHGRTTPEDRKDAVENFQNGKSDVFLISLRAGGLGLNLTSADAVILLDPWWNPAVEDQAADRAHRLGQENPVTIYRLIAHDTIEDKIIELHNRKKDLAIQLLDDAGTAAALSADELLKLLQDTQLR